MNVGRIFRQKAACEAAMQRRYGRALFAYRHARQLLGQRLGRDMAARMRAGESGTAAIAWLHEQQRIGELLLDAWAQSYAKVGAR